MTVIEFYHNHGLDRGDSADVYQVSCECQAMNIYMATMRQPREVKIETTPSIKPSIEQARNLASMTTRARAKPKTERDGTRQTPPRILDISSYWLEDWSTSFQETLVHFWLLELITIDLILGSHSVDLSATDIQYQ